jgi:hypothetical protein
VPIGAGPDGAPPPDDAPAAASVGISLSSFQGVGAPAPPAARPRSVPPAAEPALAEAPPATETVPGLRDNVLLREALRALPPEPAPREALNVARQLLQGHVFLRVKGDARTLLAAGSDLPLAVAGQGDAQLVLIYSSGEALQASLRADGDTDTSAVGQPALSVLRLVLRGPYAGVLIDHASPPARLLLPRDLLQRALDDAHPEAAIKTLLAAPRTDSTANAVVAAMPDAPLWIAANRAADDQRMGIAESRSSGGDRFIEVFTHPLEVLALGRGDRPVPVRAAQLGAALAADDGLSGLVFDPAGPWLRVTRADLLPIIALAP